jgi:hypothetical protein
MKQDHYLRFSQLYSLKLFIVPLLVVSLMFGLFGTQVSAQTELTCADLLSQGSLSVRTDVPSVIAVSNGQPLKTRLTVSNTFPYELAGVSVLATVVPQDGDVPVDWFMAHDLNSYAPNTTEEIEFEWNIPHNLATGAYELQFYIGQGTAQQLLMQAVGSSQPDATIAVQVETLADVPAQTGVGFDLAALTINGEAATLGTINGFAADVNELEISYEITNSADQMLEGPLEISVYQGYTLHTSQRIDTQIRNMKLLPGVTDVSSVRFEAGTDHYMVVGRYTGQDGSRSSFIIPLARAGNTIDLSEPVPYLVNFGISNTPEGQSVVACLYARQINWADSVPLVFAQAVDYEITTYEIVDGVKSNAEFSRVGGTRSGQGSGRIDFSINEPIQIPEGPFVVNLALYKNSAVDNSSDLNAEVRVVSADETSLDESRVLLGNYAFAYECDATQGCGPVTYKDGSERTIFGIGIGAFIRAMWIATLVLVLFAISVYVCNTYPLLRLRKSKQPDNESY